MCAEQQEEDVKLPRNNVDHNIDNVDHVELEPKPKQEKDNELKLIFQDEPIEEQRRKEHVLEKYVRRHHAYEQIIGDKESSIMKRKRIRSDT